MRGPEVVFDASFEADLDILRRTYPDIDRIVGELSDVLKLGYELPEIPVDPDHPQVYALLLDYPPKAAAGLQQFLATYHATDPTPSGHTPYRTFTLLTITDRRQR